MFARRFCVGNGAELFFPAALVAARAGLNPSIAFWESAMGDASESATSRARISIVFIFTCLRYTPKVRIERKL